MNADSCLKITDLPDRTDTLGRPLGTSVYRFAKHWADNADACRVKHQCRSALSAAQKCTQPSNAAQSYPSDLGYP